MKTIKLLGSGCPSCRTAEAIIRKALAESGSNTNLVKVQEYEEMMKYNIYATPAIVVDEEVKIHGRIPREEEIIALVKE